jgi:hypothetical protein
LLLSRGEGGGVLLSFLSPSPLQARVCAMQRSSRSRRRGGAAIEGDAQMADVWIDETCIFLLCTVFNEKISWKIIIEWRCVRVSSMQPLFVLRC